MTAQPANAYTLSPDAEASPGPLRDSSARAVLAINGNGHGAHGATRPTARFNHTWFAQSCDFDIQRFTANLIP